MNHFDDQADGDALQRQIDRLVDDELAADERCDLLRALEAAPDGWRACALTFLEAQSLREQFTTLATDAAPASRPAAEKHQRQSTKTPVWWSIAAAALLAFGLGAVAAPWLEKPTAGLDAGAIAGGDPDPFPSNPETNLPSPVTDIPATDSDESLTFWVTNDRGERQSLRTRLVDAAEFDDRFGSQFPSAVSPALRQQMEGRGFRLSTRRRYAPLYFADGRPLVVPIEDVQIVPVKGTSL